MVSSSTSGECVVLKCTIGTSISMEAPSKRFYNSPVSHQSIMMLYRHLPLLGLVVLCAACNTAGPDDDSDFRVQKSFARGNTLLVPAPAGTDTSILGMAYDSDLNDKDADGVRHRMYPPVILTASDKLYKSTFTLLVSRTELNASAKVLFASGGITQKRGMRYAVLNVRSISRVRSLDAQGTPLYQGEFYASKIYYGWSLDYVFEGDESQLNEHIDAKLRDLLGGEFSSEVERLRLKKTLVTRGLKPKNSRPVVIANSAADIVANFTQEGSGDQPILVEYECAKSFSVPAFDTKAPKYSAGNFTLDSLRFSIAETQADGSSWDGGSPPDPLITISRNGVKIYSTQVDDMLSGSIAIGRLITIGSGDVIRADLVDVDGIDPDDPIGAVGLSGKDLFSKYYVYDEVEMVPIPGTVSVKRVTLFLSPAR